jgi:streptomycin 6-kinase
MVGRGAAAPAHHYADGVSVDLTRARATAEAIAAEWGVELGPAFEMSNYSYVAPAGDDLVLKVAWEDDDESLHDAHAFALWGGDGAVRLIRGDPDRRALLLERALPGTDLAALDDDEATAIAVGVATQLWRQPAGEPFRRVRELVPEWLDRHPTPLTPLAWELLDELGPDEDWLLHGDFHHHNLLLHGDRYVAIDPKPWRGQREYDIYPWLHNPMASEMTRERAERRIAHFVRAGLDDRLIRVWSIIRAAHLKEAGHEQEVFRSLLD